MPPTPPTKPNWKEPTAAQILSDRTILRFQQIGNLLEEDLKSLPAFKDLASVLFAQRDWRHSHDSARFYNANFCATYKLTDPALLGVVEELRAALNTTPPASLTPQVFKALFLAYDTLTDKSEANSYEIFANALRRSEIDKVHELLIEAASVIPYQGQLPTAFDNHCGGTLATHWFNGVSGTDDSWTCVRGTRLDLTASPAALTWPKPALALHNTIDGNLVSLLDDFLNPLLMGVEPKPTYANRDKGSRLSGLAFPCYEETKDDVFDGAFLGWLFLVFPTESSPTNLHLSWDAFRFAANHFADRIQEAIIEEILGEYGTNQAGRSPDEAFSFYLPRVEGWGTEEAKHQQDIKLPTRRNEEFKVKIGAKWDTVSNGTPPASLLMRCHRLHRGLRFVHENSRVEAMQKHEQMLTLLAGPLQSLTQSLSTMQRDTQELRAVLYDPAKALFASHSLLAKLFEENAEFQVSRDLKVMVSHSVTGYNEAHHDDAKSPRERRETVLNGQVILAVALCRLFGCEDKLNDAPSSALLVERSKHELANRAAMPAFTELVRDLDWLLDFGGDIKAVFADPSKRLSALKQTLFDPFKLSATKWNPAPFGLAALPYLASRAGFTLKAIGAEFNMPADWSPIPINAALSFLVDVCAEAASRKHGHQRKVHSIKFHNDGDPNQDKAATSFSIRCTFAGHYLWRPESGGWETLKALIEQHVLKADTRDWRIQETRAGNFTKPYLDLAGRILGFGSEDGQWHRTSSTKEQEIFVLERGKTAEGRGAERRFRILIEPQNEKPWKESPVLVLAWEPPDSHATSP